MSFEHKDNVKDLINRLKRKNINIIAAIQSGIEQGMELFESKIFKEQMSGRPGLKVRTGNLRRSWEIRTKNTGRDFSVILANSTRYARIHQYGGTIRPKTKQFLHFKTTSGWKIAKSVRMPKRLHIYEDFERSGASIINNAIQQQLKRAI